MVPDALLHLEAPDVIAKVDPADDPRLREIDEVAVQRRPIKACLLKGVAQIGVARRSALGDEVAEHCDAVVSIPISATTESLNAGIAASVTLYEISKLRAAAKKK